MLRPFPPTPPCPPTHPGPLPRAAKLDRVFAKPFLAALPHDDGVTCLARNPRRLNSLLSGAADGDVRLWDIPAHRCLRRLVGHSGQVRGISVTPDGEACVTCSTDCTVKLWKVGFGRVGGALVGLGAVSWVLCVV